MLNILVFFVFLLQIPTMLTNNSILRRIRYAFDFKDAEMIEMFESANIKVDEKMVIAWLKKEDDSDFVFIEDEKLAGFLNGFINIKRGKREGVESVNEKRLNNNIVFRKIKIALNLKVEDIIEIFKAVDFKVSKHEITAIFRNPKQSQYRECQNQFLRTFLQGLAKIKDKSTK